MTTATFAASPTLRDPPRSPGRARAHFALVGHPNTGRSTLFNRLCGLRTRTANYPGTTCEVRLGRRPAAEATVGIADLPGTYGLDLDLPESRICRDYLAGGLDGRDPPAAAILVADAASLARTLAPAAELVDRGLPLVVAVNKIDLARRRGLEIDVAALEAALGCPVRAVCARSGEGLPQLAAALAEPPAAPAAPLPAPDGLRDLAARCVREAPTAPARATLTDRLDAVCTHAVAGPLLFAAVMTGVFMTIFSLAAVPMELIELLFGRLGGWLGEVLPAGAIRSLAADGLVAGVAGVLVFLPQICLLFFLISLLEDSGYLARAAFVADRLLRRFGLPGHAFVPLLSAHACAIPAMMSARLIPDPRDRLVTILVAPFMSCSARLPVYVLLIGLLFPGRPLIAGLAFAGCYALGAAAAVLTAALLRRTAVRGRARPMIMELPEYQLPSLRTALLVTFDRAIVFLRNAGTVILAICVVLWWLSAYPVVQPPAEADALRAQAAALVDTDAAAAADLEAEAAVVESRHALSHSFTGRLGRLVEPVFAPLGLDWRLSVGVMSSFAAREVFVSTMAVITGAGDPAETGILKRIGTTARDDGSPMFTPATSAGLLVFYVLAMQCLPTLAVTRREAGGWRWAALQFGFMFTVAYLAALGVRGALLVAGVA